jgi:Fe-S cluster biogenesis protein NfuA
MSTSDSSLLMISSEVTPNPASMRFVLNRPVLETGTADFAGPAEADRSPLALRLFALKGVSGVFLGPNFVTVAAEQGDWLVLRQPVIDAIREHLTSGEPILVGTSDLQAEGTTETAEGIIRVIEEEIRPAVAMDGGDVVFSGYENGIVRLRLRGACSGCPSALFTLKMGIERRLKEEFPEIVSVEAV